MENPGGRGNANQKVFHGGGMDIFWNHTFIDLAYCILRSEMKGRTFKSVEVKISVVTKTRNHLQ